jgi:hypothetical protein
VLNVRQHTVLLRAVYAWFPHSQIGKSTDEWLQFLQDTIACLLISSELSLSPLLGLTSVHLTKGPASWLHLDIGRFPSSPSTTPRCCYPRGKHPAEWTRNASPLYCFDRGSCLLLPMRFNSTCRNICLPCHWRVRGYIISSPKR